MARVLIKGTQIAVPNTVGAGTSFSEATLVRLVNTATGTDHVVTVQETAGGTTVGTFTILRGVTLILFKIFLPILNFFFLPKFEILLSVFL